MPTGEMILLLAILFLLSIINSLYTHIEYGKDISLHNGKTYICMEQSNERD